MKSSNDEADFKASQTHSVADARDQNILKDAKVIATPFRGTAAVMQSLEAEVVVHGHCHQKALFGHARRYKRFPAIRGAAAETIVLTNGFSCREQIEQGTGRHARTLLPVPWRSFSLHANW